MAKSTRWSGSESVYISNSWRPMAIPLLERLRGRGIDEAFLEDLAVRTVLVEDAMAGKLGATSAQKATTAELKAQITLAGDWISVVRSTVKRLFPKNRALLIDFGAVSDSPRISGLPKAVAALDQVLGAVSRHPSEAAAAQILPRDLDRLRKIRDSLRTADAIQEEAKGRRRNFNASVTSMVQDLIDQLDRLYTAVQLEFAEEKHIIEAFRRVIPTKKAKKIAPAA